MKMLIFLNMHISCHMEEKSEMPMRDYWTCPSCKANLDFGEKCDCQMNDFWQWNGADEDDLQHEVMQAS